MKYALLPAFLPVIRRLGFALTLTALCLSAFATTKGLNQIVTPDIQPVGILSTSLQAQNQAIGNSNELQLELGLTKRFEMAVFQGFKPGETILGTELGLVQQKSLLLSAGVLGIEKGLKPQPFIEAGYYRGKAFGIAGLQRQEGQNDGVFGFGYQVTGNTLVTFDYITGANNFATAGITYEITPNLSFNPSIYFSNQSPHRAVAYGVLSWNTKLW